MLVSREKERCPSLKKNARLSYHALAAVTCCLYEQSGVSFFFSGATRSGILRAKINRPRPARFTPTQKSVFEQTPLNGKCKELRTIVVITYNFVNSRSLTKVISRSFAKRKSITAIKLSEYQKCKLQNLVDDNKRTKLKAQLRVSRSTSRSSLNFT